MDIISETAMLLIDINHRIIDNNIKIWKLIDVYDKKNNKFYEANIIKIKNNKFKIHYINGKNNEDKWIYKYSYLSNWRFHNQNIYIKKIF